MVQGQINSIPCYTHSQNYVPSLKDIDGVLRASATVRNCDTCHEGNMLMRGEKAKILSRGKKLLLPPTINILGLDFP